MGPLAADTKHSNSDTLETARRVRQPHQECSARTAPTFTESTAARRIQRTHSLRFLILPPHSLRFLILLGMLNMLAASRGRATAPTIRVHG